MLLPSDNAWDVPSLDPSWAATSIPTPVLSWGSLARTTIMRGTWHTHVDDDRIRPLLKHPDQLVATECEAAVEPDFTIYEQTPRALALESIYQRRRVAYAWGISGVRLFASINVPERFFELVTLGLPRGWAAWSTRGYAARLDDLKSEYAFASEWAGRNPVFMILGGGRPVEAIARELPGAVCVRDFMGVRRAIVASAQAAE